MEINPLGINERRARKGKRSFRSCNVKDVRQVIKSSGSLRVNAVLFDCPTMQDKGMSPISVQNTNILTENEARAAANARGILESYCGRYVCADCIYAGAESMVEVNTRRRLNSEAELEALQAQKLALEARAEVEALVKSTGVDFDYSPTEA